MNTHSFFTLALSHPEIAGLLWKFLYAFLAIVLLGGLIWAVNKYIGTIPPPLLTAVAVILGILLAIYLLGVF